ARAVPPGSRPGRAQSPVPRSKAAGSPLAPPRELRGPVPGDAAFGQVLDLDDLLAGNELLGDGGRHAEGRGARQARADRPPDDGSSALAGALGAREGVAPGEAGARGAGVVGRGEGAGDGIVESGRRACLYALGLAGGGGGL